MVMLENKLLAVLLAATVLLAARAAATSHDKEGFGGTDASNPPLAGMAADAVAGHILRRTLPPELRMRRPLHAAGSAAAAMASHGGQHATPGPPPCPAALAAQIKAAGHLSVAWTGAKGGNVTLKCPGPCVPADGVPADDAPGVQAAVELSALCGNPPVFFPGSVRYWFRKTVNITDQAIRLVGGSGRLAGFVSQGLITDSPVFIQGAEIAVGETVILMTLPSCYISIETPNKGAAGCHQMTVSPTARQRSVAVAPSSTSSLRAA